MSTSTTTTRGSLISVTIDCERHLATMLINDWTTSKAL
jgi:hypothetical protein